MKNIINWKTWCTQKLCTFIVRTHISTMRLHSFYIIILDVSVVLKRWKFTHKREIRERTAFGGFNGIHFYVMIMAPICRRTRICDVMWFAASWNEYVIKVIFHLCKTIGFSSRTQFFWWFSFRETPFPFEAGSTLRSFCKHCLKQMIPNINIEWCKLKS